MQGIFKYRYSAYIPVWLQMCSLYELQKARPVDIHPGVSDYPF